MDAGLLTESHEVAVLFDNAIGKSSRHKDNEDEDAEGDVDMDAPAPQTIESAAEFMVRIGAYVQHHLKLARQNAGGRDNKVEDGYKDGLVFEERKKLLHEFGKKIWNRCTRCTA